MNKKVIIALVAVVVVLIAAIIGVIYVNKPNEAPVGNGQIESGENENNKDVLIKPIPNIITRAGTIKEVKANKVIINGTDEEKITVYITENTKIFGPDGAEKKLEELSAGMYITVDTDGDVYKLEDKKIEALTIYVSGK